MVVSIRARSWFKSVLAGSNLLTLYLLIAAPTVAAVLAFQASNRKRAG